MVKSCDVSLCKTSLKSSDIVLIRSVQYLLDFLGINAQYRVWYDQYKAGADDQSYMVQNAFLTSD